MRAPATIAAALASFAALALPPSARAEEPPTPQPPTGRAGSGPASKGVTELDDQGKFATVKERDEDDEETDATELTISAGGMGATGNSRSFAVTGNARFRLRRGVHEGTAALVGNYGSSAAERGQALETSVANVQGRVRYDIFFHKRVSAFLMLTGRNDVFQGLDFRLNVDPGLAFYIVRRKRHRLWTEVGYDLQHDIRCVAASPDDSCATEMLAPEDRTFTNHSLRLFAGYAGKFNDVITFETGIEFLQSFLDIELHRVVWDSSFTAEVIDHLSVALSFTLRWDTTLPPDYENLDTMSAFNIVYRFF